MKTLLGFVFLLSTVFFSTSFAVDPSVRLLSPFVITKSAVAISLPSKCTALVAPVSSFTAQSRYDTSDPTRSEVDPALEAAYDAAVAPIQTFGSRVAKAADQYSQSRAKFFADCALAHLYSWAQANALLGELNNVGFLVTSTAVASAGSAYLKIAAAYPSKTATADELAKLKRVRLWLRDQGVRLANHFETVSGNTQLNNQRYTSGMAVGFAAIAVQNYDLFAAAMKSLHVGLDQIQPDGYLPLELARGSRALSYHFVAVEPLVMLMEIASVNNESTITLKDRSKLVKLVNFVYKGYKDPSLLLAYNPSLPAQETGFACNDFAFMEVHLATTAKQGTANLTLLNFIKKQRAACGDLYVSPMGGDMTYIFGISEI